MDPQPGALLGHYRIFERIGAGGMGVVYRAVDMRLDREVALKILPEEFKDSDERLARFVREAKAAAALNHPNIVSIHSVEETDGVHFITMELVRGHTLASLIPPAGLSLTELLRLAIPLIDAVRSAHEQAITHRDLKPRNIMITSDGRVKILDFGLAKPQSSDDSGDVETITVLSAQDQVLGTPSYMAPERIEHQPADHRADIFSLGVILYEMAAGHRPFTGRSSASIMSSILRDTPPALTAVKPLCSPELDRIVRRSLAKDPERRYQTARDLLTDLEALNRERESGATGTRQPSRYMWRLGIALVILAGLAGVWAVVATNLRSPPPVAPRNSVAILPLQNLSPDSETEYFSDGVSIDIAAQLSKLNGLRVISGSSILRFKDRRHTTAEIGAALGVATVLDGSVRRADGSVRVVSQLLDARTGEQIWAETYDRELKDIFAIQSEIARQIALALKGELSAADSERLRPSEQNLDAFELYMKGRHYWNMRTEDGLNRSIGYFQAAIDRDPDLALAYAGLADAYNLLGVFERIPRGEARARAQKAAAHALALDETLAEAHASLGLAQMEQFDWSAAETAFKRALDLKPGYGTAHHWYAAYLAQMGRFEQAIAEINRALALDPLSVSISAELGVILVLARRCDDAVLQIERALTRDPKVARIHMILAEAYACKKDYHRALAAAEKARSLGGQSVELQGNVGYILAGAGRRAEALGVVTEISELHRKGRDGTAGSAAIVLAGLNDHDGAFQWLDQAFRSRDPVIGYLKVDPRFDNLRADPRFAKLLGRVGLAPQ